MNERELHGARRDVEQDEEVAITRFGRRNAAPGPFVGVDVAPAVASVFVDFAMRSTSWPSVAALHCGPHGPSPT